MKLIKVIGFILQYALIGLALAGLYLFFISDRNASELLDFVAGGENTVQTGQAGHAAPAFSYADAVASSASSVPRPRRTFRPGLPLASGRSGWRKLMLHPGLFWVCDFDAVY